MLRPLVVAWARYALFSLGVALLLLGAVEVGLRLTGLGPDAEVAVDRPPWMDDQAYALFRTWTDNLGIELSDVGDLEGWRWDPALRWSLRPNLDMSVHNVFLDPALGSDAMWRLRTNSRGFRTPEFRRAKTPGTLRVVIVGDSNSMGWLLDEQDTYARRLEGHLAERLERAVEVVNLGVGGYTSFGCRAVFERVALSLDPDALVVSCGANDGQAMATTDAAYARAHAGWLGRLRRALSRLRLAALLQRLRPAAERALVARTTAQEFESNLSAIFEEARRREIPASFLRVCCCTPDRLQALDRVARRTGTPVLAANDVLAHASRSDLRARHPRTLARVSRWYPEGELDRKPWLTFAFRDRCHLNPLGSELVADALAGQLASRLRAEPAKREP